ncbi:H/ACA ribonucleoprotein complex non-core subunit NAF1 [Drosophila pseudoobscura]|uniref:H/ACA ribonucleoprotein complex non-core subunit NAF1 n=1 Tax=Drosophila pseudoobscura pseudoobscura TaxID=46245 RepID=A0A6I8UKH0_DROPS|nr:H/ACA ribonucleoprotein complex non-core subunit NAF1 [Drosophila pseudoobscura]
MENEQPGAVVAPATTSDPLKTAESIEMPATTESPAEVSPPNDAEVATATDKVEATPQTETESVAEKPAEIEPKSTTTAANNHVENEDQEKKEKVVANAESPAIAMDCEEGTPQTPPNVEAISEVVPTIVPQAEKQATIQEMDCPASTTPDPKSIVPPVVSENGTSDTVPESLNPPRSGLSLLAAYSSDAESDSEQATRIDDSDNEVVEVPLTGPATATTYRRPVVAVSSGSENEKSSSSSDSDTESEGEYLTVLRKKIDKKINTEDCDEDDEDFDEDGATGERRRRQPPKVRGEMLLDELPPIHQLEITVPEDECIELGKVHSIVDQLVLVSVIPNSMLFDLDTVLFLEKGRKVLGEVFDVLGQVSDPLYCVRFNTNQQIQERGIKIGDVVYCAPKTEHTQFVILSKLMQVRGSDASWEHDVEPPARYIDYSDDEAEREAKQDQRKRRQRDRTNSTDSISSVSTQATEASSAAAPSPRQRGRRGQRDSYQNQRQYQNQSHQGSSQQQQQQARDSQYNYHPSYNPGSWHSNYYHNYHQPAANFNMPQPGIPYPMPPAAYGYGMPYAMPQMMHMGPPPPHHMYAPPPPPSFAQPQNRPPPPSGS